MTLFEQANCRGHIEINSLSGDVTIKGTINDSVLNGVMKYTAASPCDKHASFSGSGLPFSNTSQAFENTKNQGVYELHRDNYFDITIKMPNSYYSGLGTYLIPPSLYLIYDNGQKHNVIQIELSTSIPYRMLTYPFTQTRPRENVLFYENSDLPIRTQEQILRDSAYPTDNKMAKNFWGLKPSH